MDSISSTIALDFDGVITNPHNMKSQEFTKRGYNIPAHHTEREYCIEKYGIPLEIYKEVSFEVNCTRLKEVPLEKGVIRSLDYLIKHNFKIVIVTSRMNNEIEYVNKYLKSHNINISQIFNTNQETKMNVIENLRPVLFVDDSFYKVRDICGSKIKTNIFLFRNIANSHYMEIVKNYEIHYGNWDDIIIFIERLSK